MTGARAEYAVEEWDRAREVFNRAFKSSMHFAIASVGEAGEPWVTPIGSVLLTDPGRGIYFEKFTQRLRKHVRRDDRVAILAVDSGKLFWVRALLRGRFPDQPGLRLRARVIGARRPATERERARWLRRVRWFRGTRGHELLWDGLVHVRDFEVQSIETVRLGAMTVE